MWNVQILVCVLIVISRSANAEYENLKDLPVAVEYDLHDAHDGFDLFLDNIWEEDSEPNNNELCEKYDVLFEGKLIDCKNLKVVPKILKVDEHSRSKREADADTVEDGSGEGPPEIPDDIPNTKEEKDSELKDEPKETTEPSKEEEKPLTDKPEAAAETPKEKPIPVETEKPLPDEPKTTAEPSKEEEKPLTDKPEEAAETPKEKPIPVETEKPLPDEPKTTAEPSITEEKPLLEEKEKQLELSPSITQAATESTPKQDSTPETESKIEESVLPFKTQSLNGDKTELTPKEDNVPKENITSKTDEIPATEKTDSAAQPEEDKDKSNTEKKGSETRLVTPETEEKAKETESKKVESEPVFKTPGKGQDSQAKKESINTKQDGNAIVDTDKNMKDTEKKLKSMKPNEGIKSAESEDPKSGESSEATASGKNNTLLITLFVAVLAVGTAAFAYNFIKKRKNKNSATTVQNGTTITADPEEGREMKPLMKSNEQPKASVEYQDDK